MLIVIGIIILLLGISEGAGGAPGVVLGLILIGIGCKKIHDKDPETKWKKARKEMIARAERSSARFSTVPMMGQIVAELRRTGFPKRRYYQRENVQGSTVTKGYTLEPIEIYKNRIAAGGRVWQFSAYNMQNLNTKDDAYEMALWFANKLYGNPNEWQVSGLYGNSAYYPSSNPISEYFSRGPSDDPLIGYSVSAKHEESFSTNKQAWK